MICTRERCQLCGDISPVGFHVPDETWRAAVHPSLVHSVLCLPCFASMADEKLIRWDEGIRVFPVSLAGHLASQGIGQVPTKVVEALTRADSELSAYANHRPLSKQDALAASDLCRSALRELSGGSK